MQGSRFALLLEIIIGDFSDYYWRNPYYYLGSYWRNSIIIWVLISGFLFQLNKPTVFYWANVSVKCCPKSLTRWTWFLLEKFILFLWRKWKAAMLSKKSNSVAVKKAQARLKRNERYKLQKARKELNLDVIVLKLAQIYRREYKEDFRRFAVRAFFFSEKKTISPTNPTTRFISWRLRSEEHAWSMVWDFNKTIVLETKLIEGVYGERGGRH